jgi:alanyl-tRNA synthetase
MDKLAGREVNGVTLLAEAVEGLDRPQLRTLADSLRNKWSKAVIVLASVNAADVSIVATVSKDLTSKVQAGKLVSEVARQIGGKGGGRPDMAEGAGKNTDALPQALQHVYTQVPQLL